MFLISSSAGELASGRPVLAGSRVFGCQPLCHHFFPHKPDTRRSDQTLTFYSSSQQRVHIFLNWIGLLAYLANGVGQPLSSLHASDNVYICDGVLITYIHTEYFDFAFVVNQVDT